MEAKGFAYWEEWLDDFKKWVRGYPEMLDPSQYYEVHNLDNQDLADIADILEEECQSEDYRHRKKVEWKVDSEITVDFYGCPRSFTYTT